MIDEWFQIDLPLLFDELVKNEARAKLNKAIKKKKTVIDASRKTNDKLTR